MGQRSDSWDATQGPRERLKINQGLCLNQHCPLLPQHNSIPSASSQVLDFGRSQQCGCGPGKMDDNLGEEAAHSEFPLGECRTWKAGRSHSCSVWSCNTRVPDCSAHRNDTQGHNSFEGFKLFMVETTCCSFNSDPCSATVNWPFFCNFQ